MSLDTISCPICGSNRNKVIFKSKDFRLKTTSEIFNIVKCVDCSFIFLNPRPKIDKIGEAYTSDFNKSDQSFLYKIIEPFFRLAQKSTIKMLKRYKKNGNILDVGCGNGTFMLAMQNSGYDVWGVEFNKDAKKYADNSLKGHIFYDDIKECNFPPKNFDIVTMFHSLEHIYDINDLLVEVRRIIKDDGILFICVPDADFFEFRLFGPYNYNLEAPRHLYFFTHDSLRKLLQKRGFTSKRLLNKSIFELILSPASLYHGLWNFLEDKKILINNRVKNITFIPLVIIRFFLCILFIFNRQNIEMLFRVSDGNENIRP